MADFRSLLHRLADASLLAWEDMPADLAREVRKALADDSIPSPAPTDSGAEPARGEGASARACWDCAHDSEGDGRGVCTRPFRGPHRYAVSEWIRDNCTSEPLPGAKDCPGWTLKSGKVSDG